VWRSGWVGVVGRVGPAGVFGREEVALAVLVSGSVGPAVVGLELVVVGALGAEVVEQDGAALGYGDEVVDLQVAGGGTAAGGVRVVV